jgi:hypothetical protein
MQAHGITGITVRDLDRLGDTDENHVQHAAAMGYVLWTCDADCLRLHSQRFPHAGIVFAIERAVSIGDWVRSLDLICGTLTADEMKDHIEYL